MGWKATELNIIKVVAAAHISLLNLHSGQRLVRPIHAACCTQDVIHHELYLHKDWFVRSTLNVFTQDVIHHNQPYNADS